MSKTQELLNRAEELMKLGEHEDAFLFFDAASNLGDPKAQYHSALMLESGIGTTQDAERARRLYFSAAELGYLEAQAHVGGFYATGNGVEVDYEQAAFWFEKAASLGNPTALNDLGNMFRWGLFFKRDEEKAITLYKQAAELGCDAGQLNYGTFLVGSENPKEVAKGVTFLEQAAANGSVKAQTTLALHHVEGKIVYQDFDRAFNLFQAAAASGDTDGIIGLGMSYLNGHGC